MGPAEPAGEESTMCFVEIGQVLVSSPKFIVLWRHLQKFHSDVEIVDSGTQIVQFTIKGDRSRTETWTPGLDQDGDLMWEANIPLEDRF